MANRKGRILVVEDNDPVREVIRLTLTECGYHVHTAAGGIKGLETIQSNAPFDLAILDIVLPDLSGSKLLRYLKVECPDTEVIVISAYSSQELRIDAVANGAFTVFQKPFRMRDLVDVIDRLLKPPRELA